MIGELLHLPKQYIRAHPESVYGLLRQASCRVRTTVVRKGEWMVTRAMHRILRGRRHPERRCVR